ADVSGAGGCDVPDAGAVGFGLGKAASSRIVFCASLSLLAFVPRYASARLLIMKIAANTAVARDNAVVAPRAPNTVPEAPAPKPAPASAPLPRWSSTRPTIPIDETTCMTERIACNIEKTLS